jgi:hypothetical protein
MGKIIIEMALERETKNKVRYDAVDDSLGVESIYIQKAAIGKPFPEKVTVEVSGEFQK